MSLLPDSASFHERVQDCFVAYRGRGVSLSPADYDLVEAWAATEVPFEVVARGIRKAAEAALWDARAGEGALKFLSWCKRDVEAEIAKYLKRAVGRPQAPSSDAEIEPFHLARHTKLVSALKKLGKSRPELVRWLPRLRTPSDFTEANRHEELALALILRAEPFPARLQVLREARRLVQKASTLSAAARLESLRFHRGALVRHAVSLPAFW